MKTFLTEDFLLRTDFAKLLYHDYAKSLPIIDYHNHLTPQDIANNTVFGNISQVWLAGDHYKWRAMRTLGIDEKFITGNTTDKEKFLKWAEAVPYTVRNPLYHWSHMELLGYFDIDELLSAENGEAVYEKANSLLQQPTHHTVGLLEQYGVEVLCTTDDPTDSLEHHKNIERQENIPFKVLPAFRPDKAYTVENTTTYLNYLEQLETVTNTTIITYADLLNALENRMDYFHAQGGRLSDHGLEQLYYYGEGVMDCETIFKKLRDKKNLDLEEVKFFKAKTLLFLGKGYHKRG